MSEMDRLLAVMAALRDPRRGCPWDREQTFHSVAPYTIEEAYEVADAITRGDTSALREELGDLLFQVVFHAQMASETGQFDFDDVVRSIVDKMRRRHPHVFARPASGEPSAAEIRSAAEQSDAWEAHKARERAARSDGAGESVMDAVTRGLPAFRRALKLQRQAARCGFDWAAPAEVVEKVDEEIREIEQALEAQAPHEALECEVGDLLFTCVNLARHLGIDPEAALRRSNVKFERRFRRMEALLHERGTTLGEHPAAELERLWTRAKAEGL